MSDLPYMQLYVKDIFMDTAQLSDAEFAVYHKLLYAMWMHGGSVPDDDRDNARLTGRTVDKYRRAKARLMPMLMVTEDGRLSQKRLISEYRLAMSRSEKNAENANTRWAYRSSNNNKVGDATAYAKPMPRAPVPDPEPDNLSSLRSDKSAPPNGAATVKGELEAVLDPVHAKAVIDHRQRLRKPMTAHAAHLLAAKFSRCPDPNAAADAMVSNGWQGFEPIWMQTRVTNRGQAPPGYRNSDGILALLQRKLDDGDEPNSEQPRDHQNVDDPFFRLAAKRDDGE